MDTKDVFKGNTNDTTLPVSRATPKDNQKKRKMYTIPLRAGNRTLDVNATHPVFLSGYILEISSLTATKLSSLEINETNKTAIIFPGR